MDDDDLFHQDRFWFTEPPWFIGPKEIPPSVGDLADAIVRCPGRYLLIFSDSDLADRYLEEIDGSDRYAVYQFNTYQDAGNALAALAIQGAKELVRDFGRGCGVKMVLADLLNALTKMHREGRMDSN